MLMWLPRWVRIGLVLSAICFIGAASTVAYRWSTAPVTLTVAVASIDGEAPRLMNAIASWLPLSDTRIRLKVIPKESTIAATDAFVNEEVDLAVVRSDVGNLSAARAVFQLAFGTVLIAALPGSQVKSIDELKGKTVGVVGGEVNRAVVEAIDKVYELTRAKTILRDLAFADVPKAVQSKQVQALLFVIPTTERYLGMLRDLSPRSSKQGIQLLPIDAAASIATLRNSYETYELPKGAVRGSPSLPDEDMTTLRVPFHLVANRKISDEQIIGLVKAIVEAKRELVGEYPILAQIVEPNNEKAASIPIHPGASAFFAGEEKTFFERYGDALFYGMMLLGSLTSAVVGTWKFMGFGAPPQQPFVPLYDLFDRVRAAKSHDDLDEIEAAIDEILKSELGKQAQGVEPAPDTAALSLAAQRIERLIGRRRAAIEEQKASAHTSRRLETA